MARIASKSMDIVSSHSWSHSNQKRRRSTSLSLKKPKQKGFAGRGLPQSKIFVEEISRRLKEKKSGRNRSQNREKQSSAKFRRLKKASAKSALAAKPFRNTVEVSARVFRSCESKFGTRVPLRSTVASIWQLRNALRSGKAQISHQKSHSAGFVFPIYTGHLSCEKGFKNQSAILASCSSSSVSHAIQASGHLLRSATSAKVRYPEMARTRGAKSSSPSNRKKSLRKEPVPDLLQSLRSRKQFLPVKPAPPKPPARRYLTSLRQFHHRFQLQFPRQFNLRSISGTASISGAASKISGASSATSEPQIPSETALEEVIRRPMLPQPPIEGNLDCRAQPFHSKLCFDLGIQSEAGACPIIPAAEEVSHGALVDSKRFFLSPDSHGFLSIHDNQRGQESNFNSFHYRWETWHIGSTPYC
ncbi:hypothetical protein CK203_111857 [Vitis vinifera]|uniref:Uncharacterized protein n=1 Tax=Vitis vinifera TaxID=29760 RepID=A0A438CT07_VITVI|nr:hypothetical protein CK203_111857 [Vitis vinifera]